MSWTQLSADERGRTLDRVRPMNLSDAHLSSPDDLIVGAGGATLGARHTGKLKPTMVKVKSLDELIQFFGHPVVAKSAELTTAKMNDRHALLRLSNDIESPKSPVHNLEGRSFNQLVSGLMRQSIRVSELTLEQQQVMSAIASRVTGIVWLLPNIVIQANSTLSFNGSGPNALVANKITIQHGGRIASNQATVSISCNTLEIQ